MRPGGALELLACPRRRADWRVAVCYLATPEDSSDVEPFCGRMRETRRALNALDGVIMNDREVQEAIKRDPIEGLRLAKEKVIADDPNKPAYYGDRFVYRTVVIALAVAVVLTVLGGILTAWSTTKDAPKELPGAVVAIGSASVGAMAGLLAPSPMTRTPKKDDNE